MTKLAQGARDLHSGRSQVDFAALADLAEALGCDPDPVARANTALDALHHVPQLGAAIADRAKHAASQLVPDAQVDILIIDRAGTIVGRAQ